MELSFVFPAFALFLFGIFDFAINWNYGIQNTHAAREVVRAATVARTGEDTSCTPVGLSSPPQLLHEAICLAKKKTGRDPADVRVRVFYMDEFGQTTTDVNNNRNSIAVCVMSRGRSATLLLSPFFDGRVFRSRAVAKTAKPFGGSPVPYGQETALPGTTWTWCDDDLPGA